MSHHDERESGVSFTYGAALSNTRGLGLIQTYAEHKPVRVAQEWQDIKAVWVLH